MEKKTVIITGANSGIGKAAANKFAAEGHEVVLACRNLESGKKTQAEIVSATKNPNVHLEEVDMSSFESIRKFGEGFMDRHEKLDILVHNAAYFNHGEKFRLSTDHIELTFATNVAGPFLLTHLLLEYMKKSDDARILNACSNIIKHFFSPKKEIDFSILKGNGNSKAYRVYDSYRDSKMALLMLTFVMAEKYSDFNIKVNALQINGARMSRETLAKFKPPWRLIAKIQNMYFPLPEVMALNYFEICTSKKFRNVTGKLINHKQEVMQPASPNPKFTEILGSEVYPAYARRKDIQGKVWRLCEDWTLAK